MTEGAGELVAVGVIALNANRRDDMVVREAKLGKRSLDAPEIRCGHHDLHNTDECAWRNHQNGLTARNIGDQRAADRVEGVCGDHHRVTAGHASRAVTRTVAATRRI